MSTSNRATQLIFIFLAIGLGVLGLSFLTAAGQAQFTIRLVIGVLCLLGAGGLIYLSRLRPVQNTHIHKMELDLPGEVKMKGVQCTSCGASLDSKSVSIVAGAVHVNCPYCGSSYQIEEAPKW